MPQPTHPTYFGKICELHPELKGERRIKHYLCVKCFAANRKTYKVRRREAMLRELGVK